MPYPVPSPAELAAVRELAGRIVTSCAGALLGKHDVIQLSVAVLLAEGSLLLEDVPGVGKTTLARSMAQSIDGSSSRIQFTPDLLPSDVTGALVFRAERGEFEFRPGPIFANIVIADEINRTSPKTQAALLEAMQEAVVTVDGASYPLPRPFMVVATQNPIDMAGTYPLPEAQRDRFMACTDIGYPEADAQLTLLDGNPPPSAHAVARLDQVQHAIAVTQRIHVSDDVKRYVIALVEGTRSAPDLRLGASPRAAIHLVRLAKVWAAMANRSHVLPDDVQFLARPVLAHRLVTRQLDLADIGEAAAVVERIVATTAVHAPGT